MTERRKRNRSPAPERNEVWELSVFVTPGDAVSLRALENLERICSQHLASDHRIEVVNIEEDPRLADDFEIIVTPTVIRRRPKPERRIIGDLSAPTRALAGLGIVPSRRAAYEG